MGAGASSTENEEKVSMSFIEKDGFMNSFETLDADHSGQLDKPEFITAAKSLGIELGDDELAEIFLEVDKDNSGTVDHEEFVKFCVEAMRKAAPGTLPEGTDCSTIANVLSAEQAQHGFKIAHLILDKNPNACKHPMKLNPPGSPWLPLHYLLTLDCASYSRQSSNGGAGGGGGGASAAAAADAAYHASAESLILRILKYFPTAASQRTMEGVRYPMGCLPLEYAITRHWGVEVVTAIIKANPLALQCLDPIKKPKGKDFDPKKYKATSIKGQRWMRQIALNIYPPVSSDILRLLPNPTKDSPPKWINGDIIEKEQIAKNEAKAEKDRKKKEKAEKKAAALEAKNKKKSAKQE
mmetsp:Transcript_14637/g.19012  ORF Transcript_14637/g.19012 Transcript_14637/m.19012 type:complete len:353 (+) Transcript_14637:102-1160(+)